MFGRERNASLLLTVVLCGGGYGVYCWTQMPPVAPLRQAWQLEDAKVIVAKTSDEVSEAIREVAMGRQPAVVRVEFVGDASGAKPLEIPMRPPTEEERAYVLALCRDHYEAKVNAMPLVMAQQTSDPLQYQRNVGLAQLSMLEYAAELASPEGMFVTDRPWKEIQNSDKVHYTGHTLRNGDLVYVPIDLDKHPEVRAARDGYRATKEALQAEARYAWLALAPQHVQR